MQKYNSEQYPTLRMWTYDEDYVGPDFSEYYLGAFRQRESNMIEESNFWVTLKRLGYESETVRIIRHGHWGCGWLEWVAVHYTDTKALDELIQIAKDLKQYPLLDEDDYVERRADEAESYWRSCSIEQRMDIIIQNRTDDTSIFAARHEYMPSDMGIEEYLENI